MKNSSGFSRHRRQRTTPVRRAQLLAAFERSGLSATAFARQHAIGYTTFCGWRHRQAKRSTSPAFVEVEVATPATPIELWMEVGAHARLCLTSAAQLELAARFLHHVEALAAC